MAVCGNCGAETTRVRSRWREGKQLPDQCPSCAPQSFEKFSNPSDKKIWMGYEAHPNEYVKSEDGGFDRKPEYRAEQEQKLTLPAADDAEAQARAEANKRADRRTQPMQAVELQQALYKAQLIAQYIERSAEQAQKEADQAELYSWMMKAKDA